MIKPAIRSRGKGFINTTLGQRPPNAGRLTANERRGRPRKRPGLDAVGDSCRHPDGAAARAHSIKKASLQGDRDLSKPPGVEGRSKPRASGPGALNHSMARTAKETKRQRPEPPMGLERERLYGSERMCGNSGIAL